MNDEQALTNIAANLRRLRGEKSLRDVAFACGTYAANIRSIELGKHMPGAGLLRRIAEFFDCSTDDLYAPPKKVSRSA